MGFSLKKWIKRATTIPKSVKKIKVGNVLKNVISGQNPVKAVQTEQQRIAEEKAAQQAAADATPDGAPHQIINTGIFGEGLGALTSPNAAGYVAVAAGIGVIVLLIIMAARRR